MLSYILYWCLLYLPDTVKRTLCVVPFPILTLPNKIGSLGSPLYYEVTEPPELQFRTVFECCGLLPDSEVSELW